MGRRHSALARTRRGHRGFTIVEAMMTLLVMFIGIMGMGALAAASVRTNVEAQNMTRAMNLADRIAGMLRTEGASWNSLNWNPGTEVSNSSTLMPLLERMTAVSGVDGEGWAEVTSQLPGGGPMAFDRNLDIVATNAPGAQFCAFYNLTWLQLNETIRADVRVYWRRDHTVDTHNLRGDCGEAAVADLDGDSDLIRAVARSVIIVRNDRPVRGSQ